MKKIFKYLLLFILLIAVIKDCTAPKKEKKQITDKTPAVSSIDIRLLINYDKPQVTTHTENIFGLNTGFIWTQEIDKVPGFVDVLKESGNVVLRFPGGGVANNYYPDEVGYGYNPRKRPIGFKSIMLYNQTKDRKYNIIENFISLCKQTNAKAIYCANVLDGSIEKMQIVIDRLKKENIEIVGVELGNEFNLGNYRHLFPSGQVYLDTVQKYIQVIRKNYPELKIGLIAEGLFSDELDNKRNQFMHTWNKTISNADFDAYIVHSYFPIDDKQKNFDDVYLKSTAISNPYSVNYTARLLDYFKSINKGKEKKIWITEWGIFNYYTGNTFLQAASVGQFLSNVIQSDTLNKITVTCLHDIGAMIIPTRNNQKYTYKNETHAAGSIFFPYKFMTDIVVKNKAFPVAHQSDKIMDSLFIVQTFYSKESNKTFVYFINTENTKIELEIPKSKPEKQIEYIHAETLYGNSGSTSFLKDYPSKNNLINYKTEEINTEKVEIAPYSLGVISF